MNSLEIGQNLHRYAGNRASVRVGHVPQVLLVLPDERAKGRPLGFRNLLDRGGKGTATDDEVAGIDTLWHGQMVHAKPVQRILDTTESRSGLLWIAGLQRLLVLLVLIPETRDENIVLLAEIRHL